MSQRMLAAAAHAQDSAHPFSVLVHGLVKLWPLLLLVVLGGRFAKEAISSIPLAPEPSIEIARPPR